MNTAANFTADLKNQIINRLNDYAGTRIYMCDLAYKLFEAENVDGTVTYNTYKAKEFIKENWDLMADLVEYVKDNLQTTLNPFLEPEKAHVYLLLEGARPLLSQLPTVDKYWNDDEKELTPKLIKQLTKEINDLDISDEDLF